MISYSGQLDPLPASDRHLRSAAKPLDVLYILGPRSPRGWFTRALQDQDQPIQVQDSPSLPIGLDYLRSASFDVVVIDRDVAQHSPAEILSAIQTTTHEQQAVAVLSDDPERRDAADYLAAGAAAYLPLRSTTPTELAWQLQAAAERSALRRENEQLRAWRQRQAEREQREVVHLLTEHADLLRATQVRHAHVSSSEPSEGPEFDRLQQRCRELLEAYIIMGRGQLSGEVRRFADHLHLAQIPLSLALQSINQSLMAQTADRGSRSLRHIFNRGNLLILDVILQWSVHVANRSPQ